MTLIDRRLFSALCLASALGCGDSASTTGKQVELHTALVASPELDREFATETGWSVRLDIAQISVGALYYFDGEPAFVMRSPSLLERFASLLGPSKAYAHPGHYLAGSAKGQMTEESVATLSTDVAELPDGVGITGLVRSARVVLSAGLPDEAVATARGVATKGDQTVHFSVAASFAEISRSVADGEVNGCVFDEAQVQSSGTVTMTVAPHVWFNLVNFDDVAPGSEDAPTEIGSDETPHIAFALGVIQLSAYRFEFQPE